MISYKRDELERQSFSELKMGRGSPIKILWNTLKTTFLNIKLQISSSTVHNFIERFRETGEISVRKGQG